MMKMNLSVPTDKYLFIMCVLGIFFSPALLNGQRIGAYSWGVSIQGALIQNRAENRQIGQPLVLVDYYDPSAGLNLVLSYHRHLSGPWYLETGMAAMRRSWKLTIFPVPGEVGGNPTDLRGQIYSVQGWSYSLPLRLFFGPTRAKLNDGNRHAGLYAGIDLRLNSYKIDDNGDIQNNIFKSFDGKLLPGLTIGGRTKGRVVYFETELNFPLVNAQSNIDLYNGLSSTRSKILEMYWMVGVGHAF